jgi:hypothetical protein
MRRSIKGCDRRYHYWCGTGCIVDYCFYLLLEEGLDKLLVGKGIQRAKQALGVNFNACFRCRYIHDLAVVIPHAYSELVTAKQEVSM